MRGRHRGRKVIVFRTLGGRERARAYQCYWIRRTNCNRTYVDCYVMALSFVSRRAACSAKNWRVTGCGRLLNPVWPYQLFRLVLPLFTARLSKAWGFVGMSVI